MYICIYIICIYGHLLCILYNIYINNIYNLDAQAGPQGTSAARMLTYAHVCSRMLTYAQVCSRMLACAHVLTYAHVLPYAPVCSRMLTYSHVC